MQEERLQPVGTEEGEEEAVVVVVVAAVVEVERMMKSTAER